jgi:mono/diheme cytochrome c family protein
MLNYLRRIHWLLVGTILIPAGLGRSQLSGREVACAQSNDSTLQQDSDSDQAAPRATATTVRDLFAKHCASCHGADGTGAPMRRGTPEIPDFTDADWHRRHANAELLASILVGKGIGMPPAPDRIDKEQAQSLLAYVRAFAPTSRRAHAASDPDNEFAHLKEQLKELQKQFKELSKPRPASTPPKPAESSKGAGGAAVSLAGEVKARHQLFREHCAKCHGIDGAGARTRRRYPDIPDFTDAGWKAQQSDGQILTSILDGKGTEMPAWADTINQEQARGLVAYIRALTLTRRSIDSR